MDHLCTQNRCSFADVILPLAVPGTFTYALSKETGASGSPGCVWQFPSAVGASSTAESFGGSMPKTRCTGNGASILSVLDQRPIVQAEQLELWDRIAAHYLCTLGEVMIAAMPGQLTLSSETRLVAGPHGGTGHPR
jgi:primosomal protein N' (replication factor Y)